MLPLIEKDYHLFEYNFIHCPMNFLDPPIKYFDILMQDVSGRSMAEFEMKWRHWQQECQQRLEEQEYAGQQHLETIVKVF